MTDRTAGDGGDGGDRVSAKRDRLARFYRVVRYLAAHPDGARPDDVAAFVGVSRRTVYRDLRALEDEIGIPTWAEGGRWGVTGDAFLPPLRLTLPEATSFYLAARLLLGYADEYDPDLAAAFQKLADVLPPVVAEHVLRTLDLLSERPPDPRFTRHVHLLTRAWAERRVVELRYAASAYEPGREPRRARVHPYLLEPSAGTHALYLIGFDETRDAVRTFKVERILDAALTPQTFEPPPAGTVEAHLARAWGVIADQDEVEVVLRFAPSVAVRVGEARWHPSQTVEAAPDGSLLWRARVPGTLEIRSWILSWGAGVEVLAPAALRDEVASEVMAAADRYATDPSAADRYPGGSPGLLGCASMRHPQSWAVNLISDPIHGYIELTRRLDAERAALVGLPPDPVAEQDLLDSPWLQRMRRISQLQSARWVFPTAEHSRFTHSLGVMHEAGLWGRHLYPSLRTALAEVTPGEPVPSEGLVVETLRLAGLLHDVGHGPFAHFFDDHVLAAFPAPADPRRQPGKSLTHEDLSQLIIERELGAQLAGIRRAPGIDPNRDAFAPGEAVEPGWVSFLVSKPALADPAMPRWLRWLQPLLSGVFTVDNLDYVRRDAYMTGVAIGPVDVERLRRYSFISERGLTLYEPGLGALEMFLTARLFMYQQVYLHRTVRGIDLDLTDVFAPSVRAIFGDRSPADALSAYADLDEYALLHQAALWSRGEMLSGDPTPGDGRVRPEVGAAWRSILLRQPTWRSETELRLFYEAGGRPEQEIARLGSPEPGRVAIDLAEVDARPPDARASDSLLAVVGRDGLPAAPVSQSLSRLPAFALFARRYRRRAEDVAPEADTPDDDTES